MDRPLEKLQVVLSDADGVGAETSVLGLLGRTRLEPGRWHYVVWPFRVSPGWVRYSLVAAQIPALHPMTRQTYALLGADGRYGYEIIDGPHDCLVAMAAAQQAAGGGLKVTIHGEGESRHSADHGLGGAAAAAGRRAEMGQRRSGSSRRSGRRAAMDEQRVCALRLPAGVGLTNRRGCPVTACRPIRGCGLP